MSINELGWLTGYEPETGSEMSVVGLAI